MAEINNLRVELAHLRARYDSGAIPEAVWKVIRELEMRIAWLEHRNGES